MNKTLSICNMIFFVAMLAVNAVGEFMPLGIGKTGVISGMYPNLFTPAPITFAIWGFIYAMVGIFAFYQLSFGAAETVNMIGIAFIVSCITNIGWMISWHYNQIGLSLIFMLALLLSLISISVSFRNIDNPPFLTKVSGFGFGLYLGWICAATIANISVFLVKINWNRFGLSEHFWTIAVIFVGAILGILFVWRDRNYGAALGIIWAYCGILIKHISQNGYAGQYPMIIGMALVGITAILAIWILKMLSPLPS